MKKPTVALCNIADAPLVLALTSAFGLASALVADGIGDVLGWLALATPVVTAAWYVLPRGQRSTLPREDT